MRIEDVYVHDYGLRVTTTGAVIEICALGLSVAARLCRERPLFKLTTSFDAPWCVERSDRDACVLANASQRLAIHADGLVSLSTVRPLEIALKPCLEPRFVVALDHSHLIADADGGFAVHAPDRPLGWPQGLHGMGAGEALHLQLFPPRPIDRRRVGQGIAHEGRPRRGREFPSDELIRDAGRHCDVFALHGYFWREEDPAARPSLSRYRFRPCPWFSARHEPLDATELERVTRVTRESGMKFVPYVSPRYSRADDMMAELERLWSTFDFDGFYLDGLRGDFLEQRCFVKRLRDVIGPESVLYLNASDQPFGTVRLPATFVDAHCDFVLRGDSGRDGLSRADFLRECVSGRARGGHVGVWCHYGSSGLPLPFDRVPSVADQRAAHDAGVTIWRRSFWWPGKRALARFDRLQKERRARD